MCQEQIKVLIDFSDLIVQREAQQEIKATAGSKWSLRSALYLLLSLFVQEDL